MKIRGVSGVFLVVAISSLFLGCASNFSPSYSYLKKDSNAPETIEIEGLLTEHPLPAKENIKATPLTQTATTSIFLVQIRDREKFHIHKSHDLTVVVEKGYGDLMIGGGKVFMKEGDSILIPAGTMHAFINMSGEPAAALAIFTPPYDGKDNIPVE